MPTWFPTLLAALPGFVIAAVLGVLYWRKSRIQAAEETAKTWESLAKAKQAELDQPRKRKRIIIIDDEPQLPGLLKAKLGAKYDVSAHTDPLLGLIEMCFGYTRNDCFDLLILDYSMSLGGLAIISILKIIENDLKHCRTPIVLLTGWNSWLESVDGVRAIWQKPGDLGHIGELIEGILSTSGK